MAFWETEKLSHLLKLEIYLLLLMGSPIIYGLVCFLDNVIVYLNNSVF